MNLAPPSFKQNWDFYFKYSGLGLIVVSLIFYNNPRAKYLLGFGLLLLAISFMKKKVKK